MVRRNVAVVSESLEKKSQESDCISFRASIQVPSRGQGTARLFIQRLFYEKTNLDQQTSTCQPYEHPLLPFSPSPFFYARDDFTQPSEERGPRYTKQRTSPNATVLLSARLFTASRFRHKLLFSYTVRLTGTHLSRFAVPTFPRTPCFPNSYLQNNWLRHSRNSGSRLCPPRDETTSKAGDLIRSRNINETTRRNEEQQFPDEANDGRQEARDTGGGAVVPSFEGASSFEQESSTDPWTKQEWRAEAIPSRPCRAVRS